MKTNVKVHSILLSLLFIMGIAISMTSCKKEVSKELLEESPTTSFVSAEDATIETLEYTEIEELIRNQENGTLRGCACNAQVRSLTLVTAPWGDINLNIKYILGEEDHFVRVEHYRWNGFDWVFYGYDPVDSANFCEKKSVNLSTGQLPAGTYFSAAIVRDHPGGFCGMYQTLMWTN